MKRPKAKFKVGQTVNLSVKILEIDRRHNPPQYMVRAAVNGWIFDDIIFEDELRPLDKRERRRGDN